MREIRGGKPSTEEKMHFFFFFQQGTEKTELIWQRISVFQKYFVPFSCKGK